ncbi:hypothetical protein [Parafrankia sp. BMG5.11]|uniref:hypothetical protein n=1 Tax=Parafrankia sp. BMG5.11 TaxID=222540 RepID=UPI001A9CEEF4|nr:hypothetical protein [Parafrankia sp. BMG5.11]
MASAAPARSLGHIALHYGDASDGPAAAKLLTALGFEETQMLPLPHGNFYRFVVDGSHFAKGDGIIYLSALPEAQMNLIAATHAALGVGTAEQHPAVEAMRAALIADPEASFHFGFLCHSLKELEERIACLRVQAETDPDLKGRLKVTMNRARPGDADVDARLDASPLFGDVTRYAYGRNGVQVFVETDILKASQLGDSAILEFDYIFPGKDNHLLAVVEL